MAPLRLLQTASLLVAPALGQAGNPFNFVSAATLFTGPASPIIDLGYARYQGKDDAVTETSNYLGVKYANAPRFDHSIVFKGPVYNATVIGASEYGAPCPQHSLTSESPPSDLGLGATLALLEATPLFQEAIKQDEDCLCINIQRPQDHSLKDFPVLVWIHGGGFEAGESSSLASDTPAVTGIFYQGANLVRRSQQMKQPIIVTSINYRLASFGFTASKEFDQAGFLDLGLEDQQTAFRWIQKNIAKFGGDPSKMTIMGEYAGAWSVTGHLVANGGDNEGLFRAAMGLSGGPVKVDGPERQQGIFDSMVDYVGCGGSKDVVSCNRNAPYEKIYEHMGTINYFLGFRSLASAWTLRGGSGVLSDSPDRLVAAGKVANVPILYGDMRDEGTLFSLINSQNITTTEEVKDYFKTYWWPSISEEQLDRLMELYPQDPTKGSPFGTGLQYALPPQYKRIAALTGDYSFQAQRRQLLAQHTSPKWNYLTETSVPLSTLGPTLLGSLLGNTGLTAIPLLGSFHVSDVLFYVFGTIPDTISQNSKHIMGT